MRTITIGAAVVILVAGVVVGVSGGGHQAGHYGAGHPGGGYNSGPGGFAGGGGVGGPGAAKIFRFVSVHVPPAEPGPRGPSGPRIVHGGGPRDKHYNIIFVRAPTPPPPQQTQVILPAAPEQKTLVYVLIRKPEELSAEQAVKITHPRPHPPAKPEVYFVTYKGGGPNGGAPGGPGIVGLGGSQGGGYAGVGGETGGYSGSGGGYPSVPASPVGGYPGSGGGGYASGLASPAGGYA